MRIRLSIETDDGKLLHAMDAFPLTNHFGFDFGLEKPIDRKAKALLNGYKVELAWGDYESLEQFEKAMHESVLAQIGSLLSEPSPDTPVIVGN